MRRRNDKLQVRLLCGAALAGLLLTAAPAFAQDAKINIAAQPLADGLNEFARQSGRPVMFTPEIAGARVTHGVSDATNPELALNTLLEGTGLSWRRSGDTFLIVSASDPQSGSAAGDGADAGTVAALIVTAQKREENIQDVPIAISAFTEKTLEEQKIEGGFDLLKAIPNVTFSKNNFTSYNFSIRGIGTKAVSATTDPAVAVSFNNIALIQNRLFEQEYFDVERVEVLRGPQGTLYGRNATAGVINVISAKPNLHEFSGWLKGEVGNYHTKRVSAMVNVPLVEDKLAIRFAGALTDRQGYDYNSVTKNHVNGRDLWSGRLSIGFNPTERIRSNLIWERFNEDDNRSRTGKQLCHRDPGLMTVGDTPVTGTYPDIVGNPYADAMRPAVFSQGCKPGSLYNDSAFGTPNGLALPFVFAILGLGADCGPSCTSTWPLGYDKNGNAQTLIKVADPYGGMMQSRDLRTIASFKDPKYRAKADVVEFNVDFDLTEHLTLSSQTAYDKDSTYSFQDLNRFNTVPIFQDTAGLSTCSIQWSWCVPDPSYWANMAPGGVFCDPQLGCSNTLAGFDIAQGAARQFTQEFRIQSSFSGPVNFSAGLDYTRFQTMIDYYVFYNLITALAEMRPFNGGRLNPGPDIAKCGGGGVVGLGGVALQTYDINDPLAACPYIDPNSIESINGDGHNYFRSKNPYKLQSGAVFGELYWQATRAVKVTAGLRYNDDHKNFIPVPSQILLDKNLAAGGTVNRGYPELPAIKQHWGEWTGRLGVDWKPDLSFTDQTMVYAFYSRGYKAGGANPPSPGFATLEQQRQLFLNDPIAQQFVGNDFLDFIIARGYLPNLKLTGKEYKDTFDPEFVNAVEIGAKNTVLGGAVTFDADAFFYDYKNYQVSQIRDRTAVNENFNAKAWGLEFQTMFAPNRDFQVIANLGYLDTRIANGETSIDIMNRTQGNPNYVLVKPWVQLPSNCVVPTAVAESWLQQEYAGGTVGYLNLCGGVGMLKFVNPPVVDPATGEPYTPLATDANGKLLYPEINGGAGIAAQLGGNELPNAPHWTMNIGAQYGFDFATGWRATVRGDAYWQSQSWARVYNSDPYDKLHGWYNVNLSLWLERPDDGLKIELYAKNILDKTPITDAFLNSDDLALTTNVFTLDPRLIGLSIKKDF